MNLSSLSSNLFSNMFENCDNRFKIDYGHLHSCVICMNIETVPVILSICIEREKCALSVSSNYLWPGATPGLLHRYCAYSPYCCLSTQPCLVRFVHHCFYLYCLRFPGTSITFTLLHTYVCFSPSHYMSCRVDFPTLSWIFLPLSFFVPLLISSLILPNFVIPHTNLYTLM